MTIRFGRRTTLLVSALLSFSGAPVYVHAACDLDSVLEDSDKLAGLDLFFAQDCMGGAADPSPLTRTVENGLLRVTTGARTETELAEYRDTLLELLTLVEGSLAGKMSTFDSTWRSYAGITMNQLQIAREEVAGFESTVRAEFWTRGQDYGFFEQPTTGTFLISYESVLDRDCDDTAPADMCRQTVESAVVLTRHIHLVNRILANQVRDRLAQIHAELVKLDAEWDYYFNEARSQFWWEFLANNALFDPPGDQLVRPPAGQLILLHPGAAMEYVERGEFVDESLNLVGIIELVGYNRLRWRKDRPFSKWPLGASLVATWAPATPGDDWGYGVMAHVRNTFSFGVTRRDTGAGSETTWLFSVDLTRMFLQQSEEARRSFRRLDQ